MERQLGPYLAGSIIYSGSHTENLVGNGNQAGVVSYGVNINAQPGDLLDKPLGSPPTRLNSSFGPINYADNDRVGNYNGVTFDLRGRARGCSSTCHARSSSKDDADLLHGHQPAPVLRTVSVGRPRLSLTANYTFPAYTTGGAVLNGLATGWGVSAIGIYQSGSLLVITDAPFTAGGDYNADGDNYDFPDVTYDMRRSLEDYLTNGVFRGTVHRASPWNDREQKPGQFRQPNFAQTDLAFYKRTLRGPIERGAAAGVLQHLQQ